MQVHRAANCFLIVLTRLAWRNVRKSIQTSAQSDRANSGPYQLRYGTHGRSAGRAAWPDHVYRAGSRLPHESSVSASPPVRENGGGAECPLTVNGGRSRYGRNWHDVVAQLSCPVLSVFGFTECGADLVARLAPRLIKL